MRAENLLSFVQWNAIPENECVEVTAVNVDHAIIAGGRGQPVLCPGHRQHLRRRQRRR